MVPSLDVFSIENSEPTWLGSAEDLPQALEIARKKGTGSYFVFSQRTGRKLMYQVDASGSLLPAREQFDR